MERASSFVDWTVRKSDHGAFSEGGRLDALSPGRTLRASEGDELERETPVIRSQSKHGTGIGLVVAALVVAALSGCSARTSGQDGSPVGASTSEMAVQEFLYGANADQYPQMSNVFGTEKGPAVDRFGVTDVEQRMIFLASILKHETFTMRQANLAQLGPDRVRWEVSLTGTRKGNVVVPMVTVPDGDGRWYVERLNLDALTASPVP